MFGLYIFTICLERIRFSGVIRIVYYICLNCTLLIVASNIWYIVIGLNNTQKKIKKIKINNNQNDNMYSVKYFMIEYENNYVFKNLHIPIMYNNLQIIEVKRIKKCINILI